MERAKNLKPSPRGELEITDLNKTYLNDDSLKVELFGRGSAGTPLCRRLFRRSNPDRRFPGPVAVGLNSASWGGIGIALDKDGEPLLEQAALLNLSQEIEGG